MKDYLISILDNVNEWLKYAEAKNAGLLAFNGAAIAGIMSAYPPNPKELLVFKGGMVALFALSICISLYTFLPVLSRTFKYQKLDDIQFEKEKVELNCYFFKHHSKINCKQLISLISHKTGSNTNNKIELDIADQIINNAEIAVSKFRLFTFAAYVSFGGVVLGLFVIICNVF